MMMMMMLMVMMMSSTLQDLSRAKMVYIRGFMAATRVHIGCKNLAKNNIQVFICILDVKLDVKDENIITFLVGIVIVS